MKIRRHVLTLAACLLAACAAAQESTWVSHGPTGVGFVSDLAVRDSAAYAATSNGVFRSLDGGATWAQSGLAGQNILQVVARPGTVVVLAMQWTPESEAGPGYGGLFASRDQGKSWPPVPGLPPLSVAALDPWQPDAGYAGGLDGSIWRTTDAATSWQRISTTPSGGQARSFAFDSFAVYMQDDDEAPGGSYKLYRSSDAGASWTVVSTPLPDVETYAGGAAPGVVYAAAGGTFCRSADSTATWSCSSVPTFPVRILEIPGGDSGDSPHILIAGPAGVFVSADQGVTWAGVPGPPTLGSGSWTSFASDSSGSLLLAGTDTGLFRSEDRGETWTRSSAGLQAAAISALALDPNLPSTLWAAGPGLFRSTDGGFSWSPVASQGLPLPPSFLVVDPAHSSKLYAGGLAVYRSEDTGANWTSSPSPGDQFVNALAVDPGSPERVWESSLAGLFRSDDGAQTWRTPAAVAQAVYTELFDGRRPGTIYAGSYFDVEPGFYGYPYGGSIFFSYDSGATFAKFNHDFGSLVTAIAINPFDDNGLYVGTEASAFRSTDRGTIWEESAAPSGGMGGVRTLVADPVRPGRLYAAADHGVYRTLDGAKTWNPFSVGLGSLTVRTLVISPDGKWLHAATDGGGVFELDLEVSGPCTPSSTRLCLLGNRYSVDLLSSRRPTDPDSPGTARPLTDRAGYFSLPFVTGDPDLPEVVVKMVDSGSGMGAWVFHGSLTSLPYVLTVTDTTTGKVETFTNHAQNPLCGGADTSAFLPDGSSPWDYAFWEGAATGAQPQNGTLSLLGGRFSATLSASNPRNGDTETGSAVAMTDRFGYFSLPGLTGDSTFPEVAVKMIDFSAIDGRFWLFYTGLTNLDYTLTVTDSVTGAVRTYVGATPFCGAADTDAFTDSPHASSVTDLDEHRYREEFRSVALGRVSWLIHP